jgi:hypothetical protein
MTNNDDRFCTDLANLTGAFALLVEEMLDELAVPTLLAPYSEDYRIRPVAADTRMAIGVDLHVAFGIEQTIRIMLSPSIDEMRASLVEVGQRLKAVIADLDTRIALRDAIEREVRQQIKRANRAGIAGRLLDIRLSPIDLASSFGLGIVELTVEGASCEMLRPFRATWHVRDMDDVRRYCAEFRAMQARREKRLGQAQAVGAVGFIDSVALAMLDDRPEGRDAILARMVRSHELMLFPEDIYDRDGRLALVWKDGVVRAFGRLADGITRDGACIRVAGNTIGTDAIGRPVDDYVAAPHLDGLAIIAVDTVFGEIMLSDTLVPFCARPQRHLALPEDSENVPPYS